MPYIKSETREEFAKTANSGHHPRMTATGELNYELTLKILKYIEQNALPELGITTPNYALINNVIGALECCKLEFYRRAAAPYEDVKIKENGDVYPNKMAEEQFDDINRRR